MNTTNSTSNNTLFPKVVSGLTLLFGAIFLVLLPLCIIRRFTDSRLPSRFANFRRCGNHILTAINCFASGIFLGTALLHIFIDAQEQTAHGLEESGIHTDFPLTNLVVLLGIVFIMAVEQAASYIQQRNNQIHDNRKNDSTYILRESNSTRYESYNSLSGGTSVRYSDTDTHGPGNFGGLSILQSLLLTLAISVHAVFEGIAIGVANSSSSVYDLLFTISFHKIVVSISLGMNLGQSKSKKIVSPLVLSILYCLAAPTGLFIGAFISEMYQNDLAIGILQGLACGTFIYVAVFEMLPLELEKADRSRILCILSTIAGLAVTVLLTFLLPHSHEGHGEHHH